MSKPLIILPVENQVRELDAKLLLACLAVERGYRCVIGWKSLIDFRIGRFPPSIYFAKSISKQNAKMLRIKRRLGHVVVAWDEEAVVHYPPEIYYVRRIGEESFGLIDLLIAWGDDNLELLKGYRHFDGGKVRVLGNPRSDLLRPELRDFFHDDVADLKDRYGEFILINTNFGSINGYNEEMNLMHRVNGSEHEWVPGRTASGMPRDYAAGLFAYRNQVFQGFQDLLPKIAAAFPDRRIVLRPHPAENHEFWTERLRPYENVEVIGKGNVVPWLLACECLVHNGCTTAVEGSLLGTRIISFVPVDDGRYEVPLPNLLGKRQVSPEAVIEEIQQGWGSPVPSSDQENNRKIVGEYICSIEGDLACQGILDEIAGHLPNLPLKAIPTRVMARVHAEYRSLVKNIKQSTGVARYDQEFMRQRFPKLSEAAVQAKADRLAALAGGHKVRVTRREEDLFEVGPA